MQDRIPFLDSAAAKAGSHPEYDTPQALARLILKKSRRVKSLKNE
jgi:hypothetical protein